MKKLFSLLLALLLSIASFAQKKDSFWLPEHSIFQTPYELNQTALQVIQHKIFLLPLPTITVIGGFGCFQNNFHKGTSAVIHMPIPLIPESYQPYNYVEVRTPFNKFYLNSDHIPVVRPIITFEDPENFYDRLDSAMSYFVHITSGFLQGKEYSKARQEFSDILFRLVDTGKKDTIHIYQPIQKPAGRVIIDDRQ